MTTIHSRSLAVRQFSIGPAHDPYGASEYIYRCNDDTTTLFRDGLYNIRVTHNGQVVFRGICDPQSATKGDEAEGEAIFAQLTGLTYNQFNRAYEKINADWMDFEDPMGSPSSYI